MRALKIEIADTEKEPEDFFPRILHQITQSKRTEAVETTNCRQSGLELGMCLNET